MFKRNYNKRYHREKKRENEMLWRRFSIIHSPETERQNLKNKTTGESAVKLLTETFGDLIYDPKFMAWLARKPDYYPVRIITIISNYKKAFILCNSLSLMYSKRFIDFG